MVFFPASFPPKKFSAHTAPAAQFAAVSARALPRKPLARVRWHRKEGRSLRWALTYGGVGFGAALLWHDHSTLALTLAAVGSLIYGANRLPWPRTAASDRLWITGLAAGLVAMGTYGGIALWQSLDNPLLALALITQGSLTVGLAGLVGYLLWQQRQRDPGPSGGDLLTELGHPQAIRRLRALRMLAMVWDRDPAAGEEWRDYLYVLVSQESDAVVRRDALRLLGQLPPAIGPLPAPVNLAPRSPQSDRTIIPEAITEPA